MIRYIVLAAVILYIAVMAHKTFIAVGEQAIKGVLA